MVRDSHFLLLHSLMCFSCLAEVLDLEYFSLRDLEEMASVAGQSDINIVVRVDRGAESYGVK